MTQPIRTGGCQCGAIRFRLTGQPKDSSICHCRMCQKAFGAYYAPLVNVGEADLVWTRGEPKYFPIVQARAARLLQELRHTHDLRDAGRRLHFGRQL